MKTTPIENALWHDTREALVKVLTHEFNNLVGGTYALSELYDGVDAGAMDYDDIFTNIKRNSTECRKLFDMMRELYCKDFKEPEYMDLREWIEGSHWWMKKLIERDQEIHVATEGNQWVIKASNGALRKLFMMGVYASAKCSSAIEIVLSETGDGSVEIRFVGGLKDDAIRDLNAIGCDLGINIKDENGWVAFKFETATEDMEMAVS